MSVVNLQPTTGAGFAPETLAEIDIDFAASASEDVAIAIGAPVREVLRGRLWIDADPGAAFAQWLTLTFYAKAAKTGDDAYYRTAAKLVYTELATATTGSDANIIPDDYVDFTPNDLVCIYDTTDDYVRLATVASTMTAEDNPAAHAINQGVVRVVEFSGFSLLNLENAATTYLRVAWAGAQTVSLKMELVLRG